MNSNIKNKIPENATWKILINVSKCDDLTNKYEWLINEKNKNNDCQTMIKTQGVLIPIRTETCDLCRICLNFIPHNSQQTMTNESKQ